MFSSRKSFLRRTLGSIVAGNGSPAAARAHIRAVGLVRPEPACVRAREGVCARVCAAFLRFMCTIFVCKMNVAEWAVNAQRSLSLSFIRWGIPHRLIRPTLK